MTTPQLLYQAVNGRPMPTGAERCFWCGASCGIGHARRDHVSDSFVGYSEVSAPASGYVCGGCVLATDEADRSKRPRQASWVIDETLAQRLGWGDIDRIRSACLAPPPDPFSIIIAVSGQKHLLYRAPVNHAHDVVTAQVELQRITYRPIELKSRLALCERVAAAAGKPSLAESPTTGFAIAVSDYWSDADALIDAWLVVWSDPLSTLAGKLSRPKEFCRDAYPSDVPAQPAPVRRRSVAAEVSRPDRSRRQPDVRQPSLFGVA